MTSTVVSEKAPPATWSEADIERLRQLAAEGVSIADTASQMGRSKGAVGHKASGLKIRFRHPCVMARDAAQEDAIVVAWQAGRSALEIARDLDWVMTPARVAYIVTRARMEGDTRAIARRGAAPPVSRCGSVFPAALRTLDIEAVEARVDHGSRQSEGVGTHSFVSLPRVSFLERGLVDPLLPIAASIERDALARRGGNRTAALLGDPAPERSALGRETLPSEQARLDGQGRYRDRSNTYLLDRIDDGVVKRRVPVARA